MKRNPLSLALLASLGLAQPPLPAQPPVTAPPPVRFELPNGLRVWVQEVHSRPVVLLQTTYKVGSINDGPGRTGTAHYVEHMVYRATQNIRNEDIYGYIDRIGGRYTGGTAQLATTYTETVPSWGFGSALHTSAERMTRALFDSAEFERERTNVLTEVNGYVVIGAAQLLRSEVLSTSFELHPYRQTSGTWARDNLVLTREQALDFYKSYYGPNNAVLAIIGDVNPDEVRRLVEKHFASLTRAPMGGAVNVVEPPQRVEKRVTLVHPDDRKHLEIAYRAPAAAHPDYPVLAVLDRVLNARLTPAVAAAGGSDLTTSHSLTPYPFVYRLSLSAGASADLERLITVIQTEIDRLGAEPVAAQEMAAARTEPEGGRGGRGGRGGAAQGQGAGAPPRQSSLTQIASQLTAREVFAWDVSPETRDRVRVAQATVSAADIAAYVGRWLRPSSRTVGVHVPGPTSSAPEWSNGREMAGDRLAIPPLTTPPAKRQRPDPVQPQSLEPLAALTISTARKVLPNGLVIRAARSGGSSSALQVRVHLGLESDPAGKEGLGALAARLIAGDPALSQLGARASTAFLSNDGYFDVLLGVPSTSVRSALQAVSGVLRATVVATDRVESERAWLLQELRGPPEGGRGSAVTLVARARVLRAVAPSWRTAAPGTAESLARITVGDVSDILTRLTGGALTVSLVGPDDPPALIAIAAEALASIPRSRRVQPALGRETRPGSGGARATAQEERVAVATEPQVTVLAGLPGVPRGSSDRHVLELLNYIVGVPSYGGRLGWALTKTGLTYSSAATTTFGATAGHILFSTRCDTKNLESTIQAIREVIAGIGEKGVDEWELREAQAFTLGRTLLYGPREDSGEDAIATALLDSEYSAEEVLDLPALSRTYLAITHNQINAVARRYYRPDRLKVVAIGAVPNGSQAKIFPAGTFRSLFEP